MEWIVHRIQQKKKGGGEKKEERRNKKKGEKGEKSGHVKRFANKPPR